jgi:methionyl-tRNA formyltransferase
VSKTLRVVFFGNSQSIFSNRFFSPLLDAPCKLVGVVDVPPGKRHSTNPLPPTENSNFVDAARVSGTLTLEPFNPNTLDFAGTLATLNPDLFLAAGYMFLLKPQVLSIPRIIAINFHASLLPAYRGKHPVFWALRNGERLVGLTAHVMDPHFDTGDILYQVRVRAHKRDTVSTLYERIIEKSVSLVPRLITDTAQGTLRPIPQDEASASYYSSLSDENFHLDWTRSAESLQRWIQISPGECWRKVRGKRIYFMDAEVIRYPGEAIPGQLIQLGRYNSILATGEDALLVRWVQPEGEGKCPLSRLCAEFGMKEGDVLGLMEDNATSVIC